MLEHPSLAVPIYISGDTVWFGGIAEIARRFQPGISLLHLGGVKFPISGPLTYTFTAAQAVVAAKALGSQRVIPLHYEGWTHFREPRAHADRVLREALGDRLQWLERGLRTELVQVP